MRRRTRIPACWIVVAILCSAASAQSPRLARIIVWIVSPLNDPNPLAFHTKLAQAAPPPLKYTESTAGDFGHTAGSTGQTAGSSGKTMGEFGQTAGSTGQTAGSSGKTMGEFGQTAGSAGQTAGSTGQSPGNFGRTAGSVGRNAGDAGTTMANFGTSTADLAKVAAAKNRAASTTEKPRRAADWDPIVNEAPSQFSGIDGSKLHDSDVTYIDVYANDLPALLEMTAGTEDAPDVLLGSPLPAAWENGASLLAGQFGIAPLWNAPRFAQTEEIIQRRFRPEAAALRNAVNSSGARAFALWIADREAVTGTFAKTPKTEPIAQLALRAMISLLAGASTGVDSDTEMAQVNGSLAAAMFAGPRPLALDQVQVHADVTQLRVFGGIAFAAVRAVGASAESFGVAHALVILRRDPPGRWKILQVSPNLEGSAQARAWGLLERFSVGAGTVGEEGSTLLRNEGKKALGIAQAAPKDGETRAPQPELWWDNLGGATLQAVEWQQGTSDAWGASNLYFVPDNNSRLRTRATARFASSSGQYRWRVWSIGPGGDVVLSPWRTMNING